VGNTLGESRHSAAPSHTEGEAREPPDVCGTAASNVVAVNSTSVMATTPAGSARLAAEQNDWVLPASLRAPLQRCDIRGCEKITFDGWPPDLNGAQLAGGVFAMGKALSVELLIDVIQGAAGGLFRASISLPYSECRRHKTASIR
jgi:hypothetical protein